MVEKFKIVVTDSSVKVPKLYEIANVIQYKHEGVMPRTELFEAVKDADAIFCLLRDRIDKEFLDHASKLKIIGSMAVGYNHIDIDECRKRNIKVGNTPDVLTEATAELGVALLLATARRIPESIRCAKKGTAPVWSPYWMCGKGIQGSTIGFYGCGRIGDSMVEKLLPFNPKRLIYNNRSKKLESKLEFVSFEDVLKLSDFLIITVAQTKETLGKFDTEVMGKMKKGSILINTSRGGIVKMMDLYEVLKSGHLFAAGLDVTDPEPLPTDHPLFELDNCVILPHIGSATYDARNAMVHLTEENVYNGLLGKEMPAEVI